jgi:group I intron endonuclease
MKLSGIYKIVNRVNGKYYVGSSKDIKERFRFHRKKLNAHKHPNAYLQNAWNKHGINNFEFILIENVNENVLLTEQKYLDVARIEQDKCYNLQFLATGGELREEVRKRMSENFTGVKNNRYGTKHSEETKQRMRDAAKNRGPMSNEQKEKLRLLNTGNNNPRFGTKHSLETKQRMSISRKKLLGPNLPL